LTNGDPWDPATDPTLPRNFTKDDLGARAANWVALLDRVELDEGVVFGNVGRMARQKGLDLLDPLLPDLVADGFRLVLVGNGELDELVDSWVAAHPDAVAHLPYDEDLSRLVSAGADSYLMPSEFEPSGLGQMYAMRYGAELPAMILSGSTWPNRVLVRIGRWLARFEAWRLGRTEASPLLDKLGFGDFNREFEPARTELDWLSRDPDEVDKYVADPLCGGPYTTGLWLDLLGGLLEVSNKDKLRRIPNELPILISGGADDPVGGAKGMQKLIANYESVGHADVSLRVYGDGRHEMLNETNRDEFTTDLLDWTARQLTRRS